MYKVITKDSGMHMVYGDTHKFMYKNNKMFVVIRGKINGRYYSIGIFDMSNIIGFYFIH